MSLYLFKWCQNKEISAFCCCCFELFFFWFLMSLEVPLCFLFKPGMKGTELTPKELRFQLIWGITATNTEGEETKIPFAAASCPVQSGVMGLGWLFTPSNSIYSVKSEGFQLSAGKSCTWEGENEERVPGIPWLQPGQGEEQEPGGVRALPGLGNPPGNGNLWCLRLI